jgi:hypothetical protein
MADFYKVTPTISIDFEEDTASIALNNSAYVMS